MDRLQLGISKSPDDAGLFVCQSRVVLVSQKSRSRGVTNALDPGVVSTISGVTEGFLRTIYRTPSHLEALAQLP